ncbi:MAG: protein tyrosine phosphatase, partial [Klenkia sp.]|nr:protein tyrosine phosphatase [Klenkia sp.]
MTSRVPVPGGDVCSASRVERTDGPVFVEELTRAPAGFFEAEARGLAWVRVDGGPPLPEVLEVTSSSLTLSWVASSASWVGAARAFGAALARMPA